MSRWGAILLLLYLALGLSSTRASKAITLSVALTALVVMTVMAKDTL